MTFKIEATEPKQAIELDAGTYEATVKSVEPAEGQFGPQVKFVFTVDGETDDGGNDVELWAWSSQKLNSNTKLWRWWKAIVGVVPTVGQTLDIGKLVGRNCRVQVTEEDGDDGNPRVRLSDVLRTKKEAATVDLCTECLEPAAAYTRDGKPICEQHRAPKAGV